MRLIHILVICALVYAASYVYRIKMELDRAHRTRVAAPCAGARAARGDRGPACGMGQAEQSSGSVGA